MAKVRVPQKDGEIVIRYRDRLVIGEPREVTYNVTDGTVTVPAADLEAFLGAVDGSKEAPAETAPAAKG